MTCESIRARGAPSLQWSTLNYTTLITTTIIIRTIVNAMIVITIIIFMLIAVDINSNPLSSIWILEQPCIGIPLHFPHLQSLHLFPHGNTLTIQFRTIGTNIVIIAIFLTLLNFIIVVIFPPPPPVLPISGWTSPALVPFRRHQPITPFLPKSWPFTFHSTPHDDDNEEDDHDDHDNDEDEDDAPLLQLPSPSH